MKRKHSELGSDHEPEATADETTEGEDVVPPHHRQIFDGTFNPPSVTGARATPNRPARRGFLSFMVSRPDDTVEEYLWHPRYLSRPGGSPFGYWTDGSGHRTTGAPRDRYVWDGVAPLFASVVQQQRSRRMQQPNSDQSPIRRLHADALTLVEEHAQRLILPWEDSSQLRSIGWMQNHPTLPNPFTPTRKTFRFEETDTSGARPMRKLTVEGERMVQRVPRHMRRGNKPRYTHLIHPPPSHRGDPRHDPGPPPPPPGGAGIAV